MHECWNSGCVNKVNSGICAQCKMLELEKERMRMEERRHREMMRMEERRIDQMERINQVGRVNRRGSDEGGCGAIVGQICSGVVKLVVIIVFYVVVFKYLTSL